MKNSTDYAKKLKKLYRSLKKKHPNTPKATFDEAADALVYAIISENTSEKQAQAAFKRFGDHFLDLNDLRVSRTDEIVEMIGKDAPTTRRIASTITKALRNVFNEHHKVSLEALKKMGKRPAKSALEKIDGTSKFVVDYCMLTALEGHAIPVTTVMADYLRANDLVHPDADEQEIGGFLAKQIASKNGYEFYALLRNESESQIKKKAKQAKTTKKVKKQTKTSGKTKPRTKTKPKTKPKTKAKTTKKATKKTKTKKKKTKKKTRK
ncbi:MAG: hypothetical protein JW720_15155 [Sedimentisphaerales bacterium]|nr:hypothetical protein [Sedimentisphaerales bacterium]